MSSNILFEKEKKRLTIVNWSKVNYFTKLRFRCRFPNCRLTKNVWIVFYIFYVTKYLFSLRTRKRVYSIKKPVNYRKINILTLLRKVETLHGLKFLCFYMYSVLYEILYIFPPAAIKCKSGRIIIVRLWLILVVLLIKLLLKRL